MISGTASRCGVVVIASRYQSSGGISMKAPITVSFAALLSIVVTACASIQSSPIAREAAADDYVRSKNTKGIAILAINWGRQWGCGGFENAEIMSIGFDRLPLTNVAPNAPSEIFIDGPPRLTKRPVFMDYALMLEPGEYALSSFDIKAARSVSNVGHYIAKRDHLIQDNQPRGGSFRVDAGEIVYIGNFALDCHQNPMLWRYYTEGRNAFHAHMAEVNQKYPFIDPDKVTYRLFRTTTLGREYELPK